MMTLAQYLKAHDIRQADFAARIGTTQATVSRLANGTLSPRVETIAAIERETKGEVPMQSWVSLATERGAA